MKRLFLIFLTVFAIGEANAEIPNATHKQKLYNGTFQSCMRAIDNIKKLGVQEIKSHTQSEYCKCVAGQMTERVDIKQLAVLVQNDKSNMFVSLIEIQMGASMRFCDTKMNIKMVKD